MCDLAALVLFTNIDSRQDSMAQLSSQILSGLLTMKIWYYAVIAAAKRKL
jgi:hypothetical protein